MKNLCRLSTLAVLLTLSGCDDAADGGGGSGAAGGGDLGGGDLGGGDLGGGGTGAGGSGGSPDCGCGPLEECGPQGLCVARLIEVDGGYSIDATEVTREQYAAWLATGPSVDEQGSICSSLSNPTFEPDNTWPERGCEGDVWPPAENGAHPVVCIDWCDAYAYCASVGKRLCGAIGGGPNDYGDHEDATKSQWFNACSAGGTLNYPYGGDPSVDAYDGFDADACNGSEAEIATTVAVGTLQDCESAAYAGVFDLSGNVREWEDSCSGGTGDDACHIRGGSFGDTSTGNLMCRHDFYVYRSHLWGDLGFRCCSL